MLTDDQFRPKFSPCFGDYRSRLGHKIVGIYQRQIASQDRDTLTESPRFTLPLVGPVIGRVPDMRCRHTTTPGRIIHDIVVNEGTGVQEFQCHRDSDDSVTA